MNHLKVQHTILPIAFLVVMAFSLPAGAAPVPDVCPSGCTYNSIKTAISIAKPGTVIRVGNGTYNENIDFLGKAITVRSVNGPAKTTIDGGGSGSVVTFDSDEGPGSVLSGFTIRNGGGSDPWIAGDYYGGGIFMLNSSPTVTNCIITSNKVNLNGGGVYTTSSSFPIIENSVVSNNDAGLHGGGIASDSEGGIVVRNTTISDNTAGSLGGGLYAFGGLLVKSSIVSGNTSEAGGGGIYNEMTRNGGTVSIVNTQITGNRKTSDTMGAGGGMNSTGSEDTTLRIINSTISGNYSATSTGGLIIGSNYHMVNSIVWGNGARIPVYDQNFEDLCAFSQELCATLEMVVVNSDVGGYLGEASNIDADPLFVDPRTAELAPTSEGDYHLLAASPCIDVGTDDGIAYPDIPLLDLDGESRPLGFGYDMGADEYSGLWEEAARLDGGWAWLGWFGFFNFDFYPWIYHENHGFLYPFGTSTDNLVFWDAAMGSFWWTSESQYPYIYRFPDSAWLWYSSGTTPNRWFNNLTWGGWEQW